MVPATSGAVYSQSVTEGFLSQGATLAGWFLTFLDSMARLLARGADVAILAGGGGTGPFGKSLADLLLGAVWPWVGCWSVRGWRPRGDLACIQ